MSLILQGLHGPQGYLSGKLTGIHRSRSDIEGLQGDWLLVHQAWVHQEALLEAMKGRGGSLNKHQISKERKQKMYH